MESGQYFFDNVNIAESIYKFNLLNKIEYRI